MKSHRDPRGQLPEDRLLDADMGHLLIADCSAVQSGRIDDVDCGTSLEDDVDGFRRYLRYESSKYRLFENGQLSQVRERSPAAKQQWLGSPV